MPIIFLVILTCSFQMAAILVLFFICSPAHIHNNRKFIFGMNMQHDVELANRRVQSM